MQKVLPENAMHALLLVYVHLWIVEGALRKWAPLSQDLMYVGRDLYIILVLIFLYFTRPAKRGSLPWLIAAGFICSISLASALVNALPLIATAAGIRSYVSPVLFVYAVWIFVGNNASFTYRLCRTIVIYIPVQAVLVVTQVLSPPDSFINLEVGGEAAHFVNGLVVRASGTFSSPSGLTSYATLAIACCLFIISSSRGAPPRIQYLHLGLVLLLAILSGSRGSLLLIGIVALSFVIWSVANMRWGPVRNTFILLALLGATYLGALIFTPEVVSSFGSRIENAGQSENTSQRILEQSLGFTASFESLLGSGPGVHSQAGIALGASNEWIEFDSTRWVGELGILGLILAILRFAIGMLIVAWIAFRIRRVSAGEVLFGAVLAPILVSGFITQTPSHQAVFSITAALFVQAIIQNTRKPLPIAPFTRTTTA